MDHHQKHLNPSVLEKTVTILLSIQQSNHLFQSLSGKLPADVLYNSKVLRYNLHFVTFLKYTYSSFRCTFAMEMWAPEFTGSLSIELGG